MRYFMPPRKPDNWDGQARTFYETLLEALRSLAAVVKRKELADDVQTSLDKADTALQSIPDTGWQSVTLASDVSVWGDDDPCGIRKIGKQVYIRGAVKLTSALSSGSTKDILTLPDGYSPSCRMQMAGLCIPTNTTGRDICLLIAKNGTALRVRNFTSSAIGTNQYISIHCSYTVD